MRWIVVFGIAALANLAIPAISLAATIYTYDTLGRVSTVTYDNGLIITYQYDAAGNRTEVATHT